MARSPISLRPGPDSVALTLEARGEAPRLGAHFPPAQQPRLSPLGAPEAQCRPRREGPQASLGFSSELAPDCPAGCPGGAALGTLGVGGQRPPMDRPEAPGPRRDATCGEGARGTRTEGRPAPEEASGPEVPSAPAGPPAAFTSSFSFIRLSLSSAGERGEAEGCPPAREAEDTGARAASPDGPRQDPGRLSPPFGLKAAQGPAGSAWTPAGGPPLEGEPLSVLDADAASSCSPDPPACEGAAGRWDPLLRKCEPLLQGCLLSDRRRLEVGVPGPGPRVTGSDELRAEGRQRGGSGVDRLPPAAAGDAAARLPPASPFPSEPDLFSFPLLCHGGAQICCLLSRGLPCRSRPWGCMLSAAQLCYETGNSQ